MRKIRLFFIAVIFFISAICVFFELAKSSAGEESEEDMTWIEEREKPIDEWVTYRYKTERGDKDFTADKKIIENRLKQIGMKYKVKAEEDGILAISVRINSFSMSAFDVTGKGMLRLESENGDLIIDYGDIKKAESQKYTVNGENQYQVGITLTKIGADKFYTGTANNIGKRVDIIYDDQIISSPVVQTGVSNGQFVITGMGGNELQAKVMAACISFGPLQHDFYLIDDLFSDDM